MKHNKFSKNRLSATISVLLSTAAMSPAIAQQQDTSSPAADVEIIEVREATADELEHGHVHKEGGCGHDH